MSGDPVGSPFFWDIDLEIPVELHPDNSGSSPTPFHHEAAHRVLENLEPAHSEIPLLPPLGSPDESPVGLSDDDPSAPRSMEAMCGDSYRPIEHSAQL
ncbi:hypothetical protein HK405_015145, partial [Cladochytrium tenue]